MVRPSMGSPGGEEDGTGPYSQGCLGLWVQGLGLQLKMCSTVLYLSALDLFHLEPCKFCPQLVCCEGQGSGWVWGRRTKHYNNK